MRKICDAFPEISETWLVKGEGEMVTKGEGKGGEEGRNVVTGKVAQDGGTVDRGALVAADPDTGEVSLAKSVDEIVVDIIFPDGLAPVIRKALSKKVEERYLMNEGERSAEICFVGDNNGGGMVFQKCVAVLEGSVERKGGREATFADWMFLGAVAGEIARLQAGLSR